MAKSFSEIRPVGMFWRAEHPASIATLTNSGVVLHLSGQVSRDDNGETVAVGDIVGQAEQIFQNIARIVKAAGGTMDEICKLLILVTDPKYLSPVTEVRKKYLRPPYPAATAVVVSALAKPEWLVEIEVTAVLSTTHPRTALEFGR